MTKKLMHLIENVNMNFVEEMDCRVFGSTGRRLLSFLYLVWTV